MNRIADDFFNRSIAYLEIAIISSKETENYLYNTSEYSNVTAYLLYHSTELFLKFALYKATDELVSGHDIFKLHKNYQEQFMDDKYKITMPFCKPEDVNYEGFTPTKIAELKKKYNMSYEQQLKYPIDSSKTVYNPITFFDTEYLESYKKEFLDLHNVIV